jgi:hypothetical protein
LAVQEEDRFGVFVTYIDVGLAKTVDHNIPGFVRPVWEIGKERIRRLYIVHTVLGGHHRQVLVCQGKVRYPDS